MTITTPRMAATIERRLLVNYRVQPDAIAPILPDGLRPQLVDGSAVAGVCLIRLAHFRPAWFAPRAGHRSESAAHRIAVEWDGPRGVRTGVFIPRRHSASRLARAAGGRVFPGVHEAARVTSIESHDSVHVTVSSTDLRVDVAVDVAESADFRSSLFADVDQASEFFRKDAVGLSPTRSPGLEGLRLDTDAWRVQPGHIRHAASSFFDGLPTGAAELDHVLIMRAVPVVWSAERHADHWRR
ncbi:DUF2071 domain-containing protein [Microbacterium esteraromaticum]|uniref:DUF2071 domain-containing protein n=1 Tax=Microbacterium esteraromaticum TaxID=57043 RepID=A0A939DW61_9MICO|nr:DUF2071 domain-containing protein [Microbacterium esteraromaticum]MBN8416267.1 DUF2071 domain-containing protein [Microbacterium esteraromaticum]